MIPGAALITGAGIRVGRAMALDLAEQGWDVAVHYNSSSDPAEEVAARIRKLGRRAAAIQADLLDPEAVDALVPRASEALGRRLSLLVNNASIFEYDRVGKLTASGWDRAMGSNLRAPVFLTQAFAEQAPEAERDANDEPVASAAVINLIDMRVRKLTPEFTSYTLAKMGLWAFTRTAAQALAPHVRVNAIGPGPTLQGGRQSAEQFARQRASTLLGRGTSPEELTQALRYLLAADGVTGQLICVDGGQHLAWQTPDILGLE